MDTQRILFAFDFDHTILEVNSDIVEVEMLSRIPGSFSDRVARMIYTRSGQPYVDPSLPVRRKTTGLSAWIPCFELSSSSHSTLN